MGDLNKCSPEQFLEIFREQRLEDKRILIQELGRQKTERSIAILIEIMEGESWYLRDLAGRAMVEIGERAVPGLLRLVHYGVWYTRATAARALGRIGDAGSLADLVELLGDPNHTVQGACLASIADLVRAGQARETARLFWNQGARRAEELKRLLLAVHPDAGDAVAEILADPSSFLEEVPGEPPVVEAVERDRKNA